jgi:hypothetical protein
MGVCVGLAHRWWPVVCLVGIAAILWLFWLERRTEPRRTISQAILRTVAWAMASLGTFVVFVFALLLVASVGAALGLWGSPWDGR